MNKRKLSDWWNGKDRTYATQDQPTPKEAFFIIKNKYNG